MTLLLLSDFLAINCAAQHLWPQHGRFGDAELGRFYATLIFVVVGPIFTGAGVGMALLASPNLILRCLTVVLALPTIGAFFVLFFKLTISQS